MAKLAHQRQQAADRKKKHILCAADLMPYLSDVVSRQRTPRPIEALRGNFKVNQSLFLTEKTVCVSN